MSMETLKVKTVLSQLAKGGMPCYQLYVKNQKAMTQEEFIKDFAARIGKDAAEARFINDMHGKAFAQALVSNKVINTGNLRGYLVIEGSLPSAGAKLDRAKNPVKAVILASGELKDCVAGVLAVNDTQVVEAVLYTVQYGTSPRMNTVEGTGTLKLNGRGLKLTAANADEGVWLAKPDGTLVSDKATVTANDELTIDCSFAELPEPGTYKLVIATRNGESAADYGVVRLERNVVVMDGVNA